MDSRFIDVAIGLVLIFALTSLLVATLVEVISTWQKKRGVILQKAIVSFLGDDGSFADVLLKHPLLVSLAEGTKNEDRKPSYIGADVMITSLLSYLSQYTGDIRASSPAELVAAVKAGVPTGKNFAAVHPDFLNGLASVLQGVENDWPGYEKRLQAWYDSVTQRAIGWYKRWTNWRLFIVGFMVAGVLNVNPIVIGPRLWNDAALREAVVGAATEASKQYGRQHAAETSNTEASNSTTVFTPAGTAPGSAAASKVATSEGAGPVTTQLGALVLQPLPRRVPESEAVAHDLVLLERALPDTINAARMPDVDTAFLDKRAKANVAVDATLARLKSLIPADTATDTSWRLARGYRDQLEASVAKERDALAKEIPVKKIVRVQRRDPKCDTVEDVSAKELCVRLNDLTKLHDAGLPIGWSPPAWPDFLPQQSDAKCLAKAAGTGADAKSCDPPFSSWRFAVNVLVALFGWLLVGIGSMLGAPFWFDLLSRLMKLRASGTRIDGDDGKGGNDQKLSTTSTSAATAASAPPREPMSDALNGDERMLAQADLEQIQRVLQQFGAAVTGTFDSLTREAIMKWQRARNAAVTGELTQSQIAELLDLSQGGDEYVG